MSTNYYWKPQGTKFAEGCPGKLGDIHIGKVSGGWSFSFRGYNIEPGVMLLSLPQGMTTEVELNLTMKIRSVADWKKFLAEQGGTIVDEYGVPLSLEEFHTLVEDWGPNGIWGPTKERLKNHHDYMLTEPRYASMRKEYMDETQHWKDAEGYSFQLQEFS